MTEDVTDVSPYRGRLPFREEDARFYFGRELFVQLLQEAVENNSLTALVGPSGSGKTSLVHAGLLPALREAGRFAKVVSMRPGARPISSLAQSFAHHLEPGHPPETTANRTEQALLRKDANLVSLAARVVEEGRLLLLVDQWEELYTLARDNEAERELLIDEILAATRSNSVSVLIIVREDFQGRVMEHLELQRRLQGDCLIRLPEMSQDDLRRAVEEPAREAGLSFDDGLVEEILQDLDQQLGRLPLLGLVLDRLWNKRDQSNRKLLRSSYESMGRLGGLLARKANRIARELPGREVERLFLRLVRVEEDTPAKARRIFNEELDQPTESVASQFVEERLLVAGADPRTGKRTLEIAHEALIQRWRRLCAWVESHRPFLAWREQLEADLRNWIESGQEASFLLTEGPLQVAAAWFEKHAEDLSPEAHAYIRLSLEKRARKEGRRRGWRWAAAISILALLGLGGCAAYLGQGRAHARSAALAAEAARLADRKFDLALLLALQAESIEPTAEALGMTLSLAAGKPALRHFLRLPQNPSQREEGAGTEEVRAVAFSPRGLIAAGGKGRIILWDTTTAALHGQPLEIGDLSQVGSLAFSPDGSLLASGSETGGLIRLWNLKEGGELGPISAAGSVEDGISVQNLTFGPTEGLLAWSTQSGIYVGDIQQSVKARRITRESPATETNWFSGLTFGPSGELVWATADGRLWVEGKGQPLAETGGSVLGLAFAPDGFLLSAGSSLQRWDLRSGAAVGEPCKLLTGNEDEVILVAFSTNKRFVASGHLDRKIRLWDVSKKGCPLLSTLTGHSGLIWNMAFDAERPGERLSLVSGGEDGDLILWDADLKAPASSVPLERPSPGSLATLAVSPDGSLVAVGDAVGQVTLYDGKTRKRLDGKKTPNRSSVDRMEFSGEGNVLATGGPEGQVLLWNVGQRDLRGERLLRAEGGQDPIRSMAFSQDGAWIAAGTKAGRLLIWQPSKGDTPVVPPEKLYEGPLLALAFVTETSLFSRMLPFLEQRQREYLVAGGSDGRLILWDLEEGRKIETVSAHSQAVTSLSARADGTLASGGLDRVVRFWQVDDGLKVKDTVFLGWRVRDLDLSPRGDLLAAAGEEGSENVVVLWDIKSRIPLGKGLQASGAIRRVAFDPSGESLFLGGKGVSSWWDLRPETWTARACDMVRRGFYPIEKETYLKASEKPEICPE